MSDRSKEEDDKILQEIREAVEAFSIAEVRGFMRIAKEIDAGINWKNYGTRLFNVYYTAVKEEIGEEAAKEFSAGVFSRLGN